MNRIHAHRPRLTLFVCTASLCAVLAACGGGGGGAAESRVASVSTVTADAAPTYDNLATFSVAGTNLDLGLSATATGCNTPTVLAGGTTSAVKVTCTPSRDGDISLSLSTTSGALLKSTTFSVPKPQVKVSTSAGSLLIELEPAKAPITVKNFLTYVQDGFYVNMVFHRIISTFMAQGGGYTFAGSNYSLKANSRSPIALEKTTTTGLSNTAKTIAMARTAAPDSATSQFFINLVDNAFLNAQGSADGNGYAVFGTVVTTADVNSDATLTALKAVQVVSNGSEVSLPVSPPLITAVARVR